MEEVDKEGAFDMVDAAVAESIKERKAASAPADDDNNDDSGDTESEEDEEGAKKSSSKEAPIPESTSNKPKTLYPVCSSLETLQLMRIQVCEWSCDYWRTALGSTLESLQVLCHDITTEALFTALRITPSNLKQLEVFTNPKMTDCHALAQYLETANRSQPALQRMRLASFGLCNEQGEEASEEETEAMVTLLSKGLQCNRSLRHFELSEDDTCAGVGMNTLLTINNRCARIFETALCHNTHLHWFGATYDDPFSDAVSNINMYMRLNRAGLGELIVGNNCAAKKVDG